jgi:hypothetical protein
MARNSENEPMGEMPMSEELSDESGAIVAVQTAYSKAQMSVVTAIIQSLIEKGVISADEVELSILSYLETIARKVSESSAEASPDSLEAQATLSLVKSLRSKLGIGLTESQATSLPPP